MVWFGESLPADVLQAAEAAAASADLLLVVGTSAVVWPAAGLAHAAAARGGAVAEVSGGLEGSESCTLLCLCSSTLSTCPAHVRDMPGLPASCNPVTQFNLEPTEATGICRWAFHGKAGELLPAALGVAEEVRQLAGGASAAFDLC